MAQSPGRQFGGGQFGGGQFDDKVVWVTGAGTGIGRAVALMFAAEGAKVALLGRRTDVLERVVAEGQGLPGELHAASLDVGDRAAVDALAADLLGRWGRVDVLVNNAGINVQKRRLAELSPEDWDTVVRINLTGAYNMVRAVLPAMRKQGDGLIVNVSSMAGKRVSGLSGTVYAATKHGMNALNDSINAEEWRHGIRATVICPGEVNTDILDRRPVPVPPEERARLIFPEDLAEAVRFVAALPPRTNVMEMLVMPTHKRQHTPEETG